MPAMSQAAGLRQGGDRQLQSGTGVGGSGGQTLGGRSVLKSLIFLRAQVEYSHALSVARHGIKSEWVPCCVKSFSVNVLQREVGSMGE